MDDSTNLVHRLVAELYAPALRRQPPGFYLPEIEHDWPPEAERRLLQVLCGGRFDSKKVRDRLRIEFGHGAEELFCEHLEVATAVRAHTGRFMLCT